MDTAHLYTLGLDTLAGSRLLQVKFGSVPAYRSDQAVMHGDRRARFIGIRNGDAIIRHWGDHDPVAVPLETLSFPPAKQPYSALRAPGEVAARRARQNPTRPREAARTEVERPPRHHPHRRPLPRP